MCYVKVVLRDKQAKTRKGKLIQVGDEIEMQREVYLEKQRDRNGLLRDTPRRKSESKRERGVSRVNERKILGEEQ